MNQLEKRGYRLRISGWMGRLGNHLIQLSCAIHLAEKTGSLLLTPDHEILRRRVYDFRAGGKVNCDEEVTGTFFTQPECFQFPIRYDSERRRIFQTFVLEQLQRKSWWRRIEATFSPAPDSVVDDETLVINMRSGRDIFRESPPPQNDYMQPPLSFYKKIIEKNRYEKCLIVTEPDRANPVIAGLLAWHSGVRVKTHRGVMDDISTVLSAKHLVLAHSTFTWCLALMSRQFKEFEPAYLLPFVGMHWKVIGSIWKLTEARFCWWNQRDEGRLMYGTKREQRLLRNLPAVVSNSFEGRDFLIQKFNLPESRIRVINNGIEIPDPVEYDPVGSRYRLTPEKIVFSMVANLTQYKDHETLLRAFAIVRNADVGQRCQLILAGSYGETTLPLKALAFDLRLGDAVQFAGAMSQAEVHNLLRETDVVVHSSVCEGCPNGALEAMSHGICVLGTDISGMRQALGEEQAATCLAPPGDAHALAQLMIQMASVPALRLEFGRKNLSRIRSEFSVSEMPRAVLDTVLQHRVR